MGNIWMQICQSYLADCGAGCRHWLGVLCGARHLLRVATGLTMLKRLFDLFFNGTTLLLPSVIF